MGFLDWHLPSSDFNLAEYEHYEQVENGDLNWIVPGEHLCALSVVHKCRLYFGMHTLHAGTHYLDPITYLILGQSSTAEQELQGRTSALAELRACEMQCSMACAGKFLAFSGPAAQPFQMGTYVTHTPEDYHRYFHLKGVKAVVRLNNQVSHLFVSSKCFAITKLPQQPVAGCFCQSVCCLTLYPCQMSPSSV